jgi:hypothetical protein
MPLWRQARAKQNGRTPPGTAHQTLQAPESSERSVAITLAGTVNTVNVAREAVGSSSEQDIALAPVGNPHRPLPRLAAVTRLRPRPPAPCRPSRERPVRDPDLVPPDQSPRLDKDDLRAEGRPPEAPQRRAAAGAGQCRTLTLLSLYSVNPDPRPCRHHRSSRPT